MNASPSRSPALRLIATLFVAGFILMLPRTIDSESGPDHGHFKAPAPMSAHAGPMSGQTRSFTAMPVSNGNPIGIVTPSGACQPCRADLQGCSGAVSNSHHAQDIGNGLARTRGELFLTILP